MSEALAGSDSDAVGGKMRKAAHAAADGLGLAAAPGFAIMALLTASLDSGKMTIICRVAPDPMVLGGMVPMYLLMSGFHLAPWLRLIANHGRRSRRQT